MRTLLHLIALLSVCACASAQKTDFDKKLKDLGLVLLEPSKPVANYVKAVRTGNLLFLAGHGPYKADGTYTTGKVGKDLTIEQGYEAAKQTALSLLSTLKTELGDLNKVKRIVKVTAWINCTDDFYDQPKVVNGCSDLLVAVFGEKGKHARSSLGTNALPMNTSVEIEMVVEIE